MTDHELAQRLAAEMGLELLEVDEPKAKGYWWQDDLRTLYTDAPIHATVQAAEAWLISVALESDNAPFV